MYSTSALLHLLVVNARQYSIVKDRRNPDVGFQISDLSSVCCTTEIRHLTSEIFLVGLGRIELPTSPLSGVRSSQLSYRPVRATNAGGAGRDRTGDLLSANQALSQLSYSPW